MNSVLVEVTIKMCSQHFSADAVSRLLAPEDISHLNFKKSVSQSSVGGRLVGWSVGGSVGWSVGQSVLDGSTRHLD